MITKIQHSLAEYILITQFLVNFPEQSMPTDILSIQMKANFSRSFSMDKKGPTLISSDSSTGSHWKAGCVTKVKMASHAPVNVSTMNRQLDMVCLDSCVVCTYHGRSRILCYGTTQASCIYLREENDGLVCHT